VVAPDLTGEAGLDDTEALAVRLGVLRGLVNESPVTPANHPGADSAVLAKKNIIAAIEIGMQNPSRRSGRSPQDRKRFLLKIGRE
jgi:hypothetical protein